MALAYTGLYAGVGPYPVSRDRLITMPDLPRGGDAGSYRDEPTPILPADRFGSEYSMQNLGRVGSSGGLANPALVGAGVGKYADPDAGWVEKHSSGADRLGTSRNRKRKLIWLGVMLAILAVIGVVVGVVVSEQHRSASDPSRGSRSVAHPRNDPSSFAKDSRLHQSFYGMCYTPFESQYQWGCGANLSSVIEDVQILSQLTTRVRLYGADCNVTALTLQAIRDTKVNLTVYPAIYLNAEDPGNLAWLRQLDNITWAIDNYGLDNVGGIAIGNERVHGQIYLLNGGSATVLLSYIANFKQYAKEKGWSLPVGTADAGSVFTSTIAEGVDFMMANVHAYFAGTRVEDGAAWTWQYFQNTDASLANAAPNRPQAYIAETGWPSGANETSQLTYKSPSGAQTGAVAGLEQLQAFLDDYVCTANRNGTGYFWFELYDEGWKNDVYGGVEGYWGLFDEQKRLKEVTLPDCSHV